MTVEELKAAGFEVLPTRFGIMTPKKVEDLLEEERRDMATALMYQLLGDGVIKFENETGEFGRHYGVICTLLLAVTTEESNRLQQIPKQETIN